MLQGLYVSWYKSDNVTKWHLAMKQNKTKCKNEWSLIWFVSFKKFMNSILEICFRRCWDSKNSYTFIYVKSGPMHFQLGIVISSPMQAIIIMECN